MAVSVNEDITKESADMLVSVMGVTSFLGRILPCWFCHFSWVDSLFLTNIAILLTGLFVTILPLMESYATLIIAALCFGFFVDAFFALSSIMLVDLFGIDNLASAFGLIDMFRGIAAMAGPPFAGFLFDTTDNHV